MLIISPRPGMTKPQALALILLIVCLLMSCQTQPSAPQPTPSTEAQLPIPSATPERELANFETAECWFPIPREADINCGYVPVPEDRSQSMTEGNTIRLAVAIFHSTSQTPAPDPIVYHVGGPGGHMQLLMPQLYEKVILPFLERRDLVLFDPRGTGFSEPALECKQAEEPGDCVRRLFAKGHNLYAYNSHSMAADLQDLRRALGYDSWNLFGESYGTHVAQITMREAPEGLRSVILDAVLPVVLPALPGGQSEFELSLGRLFAHCRQDRSCNEAYPDLQSKLEKAVQQLNEKPVQLSFEVDGKTQTELLTGDKLLDWTMTAMYEAEMIPYLPFAISAAADGSNYEFWDYTVKWEIGTDKILSQGAHWAILCGDGRIGYCDDWPVAVEREAVSSEIPTLLLSGEFDPVTPPDYGYSVSQRLSQSYVFEFPGMGHWVNGTGHPCQSAIIQEFLANPLEASDASCIARMGPPAFFIEP